MRNQWDAWALDPVTWQWIAILVWAACLETYAVGTDQYRHTLTAHIRPIYAEYPPVYFIVLGLWLWIGVHFLAYAWEQRILEFFVGRGAP